MPTISILSCIENKIDFKPHFESKKINLNHSKPLKINISNISETIGYQYVLVFFPFGENVAIANSDSLKKFFEIEMLAKGYHVAPESKYELKISINKLKANVYDFFFIRKLSCLSDITLDYYIDNRLIISKDYEYKSSSYEKFAFKPKITNCAHEVLLNNIKNSFDKKYFEFF